VAVYNFDLPTVAGAMAAARGRGVQIRMVTDTDTLTTKDKETQAALDVLRAADIPIVGDTRRDLMHHKFTVVDGEWVQTGSWNYSTNDTYRHNNHMIIVRSRELAENYTAEFERMFVKKQFGRRRKDEGVPNPVLTVGRAKLENHFAPGGQVADQIIKAVRSAQQSVHFMAYSFTHDGIGQAIRDRAAAGVRVGGVFETTGSLTEASEYGRLKEAGLEVYPDGSPGSLHHKVIIIDERRVVFGSFNFSESAESNNENVLIVEDAGLARRFKEEYDRVLAVAKDPPKKK
jgi:phosphatidylserine/phosphatidylglycerophosphate/cardiolipin synthase-like enzyme